MTLCLSDHRYLLQDPPGEVFPCTHAGFHLDPSHCAQWWWWRWRVSGSCAHSCLWHQQTLNTGEEAQQAIIHTAVVHFPFMSILHLRSHIQHIFKILNVCQFLWLCIKHVLHFMQEMSAVALLHCDGCDLILRFLVFFNKGNGFLVCTYFKHLRIFQSGLMVISHNFKTSFLFQGILTQSKMWQMWHKIHDELVHGKTRFNTLGKI